jgi:geranylgeranyl reductase family protein
MNNIDPKMNWQFEANLIPDRLWDVVIVGAGPAGATVACHLAAGQHRVLLLDRKKFPREKVCGDGLLPDALRCLDTIGIGEMVRAAGHPISTGVLISPSLNEVKIPSDYLTIKRSLLDMIVAKKAVDSGALFACGEVKRLELEPDGLVSFLIQGNDKRFRARIGVVATGANLRLLRQMNWSAKINPSAVGLRCYVRSTYTLNRLVIFYDKSIVPGYVWIFPMGDHEYNVGCGIPQSHLQKCNVNLKKTLMNFFNEFPLAQELMRQSDMITSLRGAALRYDYEGAYPFINGPIVAVGETIGTTLPFIGEGIGKAMESGQVAAEAIGKALESDDLSKLSQYGQQMESKFKTRYKGYRMAEEWLARPWLNDFIFYRSGKSRYAKKILTGITTETKNPQDIFSLKGIIKTLWR